MNELIEKLEELLTFQKEWLTIDDFEKEFNIGKDMQSDLRKQNKISYSKIGTKKIVYHRDDVNKFFKSNIIQARAS